MFENPENGLAIETTLKLKTTVWQLEHLWNSRNGFGDWDNFENQENGLKIETTLQIKKTVWQLKQALLFTNCLGQQAGQNQYSSVQATTGMQEQDPNCIGANRGFGLLNLSV